MWWNTKNRATRAKRTGNFTMENLEERRLLAWGAYEQQMDLDQLVAKYPSINGKGVAIADIDSGINFNHPVFSGRIWTNPGEIAGNGIDDDADGKVDDVHGWDFVRNTNNPYDEQGHGSYTASVLVANRWTNTGNSKGYGGDKATYQGVASGAKVIPLKVIDGNLQYSVSNVEKALQWVLKNYKRYNIAAVNISLHVGDAGNTQINDEMQALYNAGVPVAASSGNWGAIDNDFAMPAGGAYAISVGAQDKSGALAGITCRGSALDMVSPGEGPYPSRTGAEYWYGEPATSFATPSVAAAAALLKSINPAFTVPQIQGILRDSGYTVYDPISKINYKALDLDNAISLGFARAGITPPTVTTPTSLKVQAEGANAVSGITKTATNLSYVDAGDWAQYKGLNLGAGVTHFAVNIAVADVNAGRQIQIRQGSATGKILGTLTVSSTGGYGIFKEQSIAISGISGMQDIYLTFSGGYGVGNIDYFRFY